MSRPWENTLSDPQMRIIALAGARPAGLPWEPSRWGVTSPPAWSRALSRLEARDLVRCHRPGGRRVQVVELTFLGTLQAIDLLTDSPHLAAWVVEFFSREGRYELAARGAQP